MQQQAQRHALELQQAQQLHDRGLQQNQQLHGHKVKQADQNRRLSAAQKLQQLMHAKELAAQKLLQGPAK